MALGALVGGQQPPNIFKGRTSHAAQLLGASATSAASTPDTLILFLPQIQCTPERQGFSSTLDRRGNSSSEKGCALPKARYFPGAPIRKALVL